MVIGLLLVIIWAYLLVGRGRFWLASIRDIAPQNPPGAWPSVVAVVPARNEADVIAASVGSLMRQSYPGPFSIIVVDDDSDDGTATVVENMVAAQPGRNVAIVRSHGPSESWVGKVSAMRQGVLAAEQNSNPDYFLFTDADIVHAEDTIAWLVMKASAGSFVLTSLMAKLRCRSLAERSHVPAFIYFFQMLYPFAWVSQPRAMTAAAAGGCMLVRADALRAAGGLESIRNALIDDCALARQLKKTGPIWLGLTERAVSIRPYETFNDVRRMIARSAYAQLGYSSILLAGTIAGMALTFLAAPLLAIFAQGLPQLLGGIVWLAMIISFQPTLRFYRLSPLWGGVLPVIALLYAYYTIDSAYQYKRRRGGQWKGRVHTKASSVQ